MSQNFDVQVTVSKVYPESADKVTDETLEALAAVQGEVTMHYSRLYQQMSVHVAEVNDFEAWLVIYFMRRVCNSNAPAHLEIVALYANGDTNGEEE